MKQIMYINISIRIIRCVCNRIYVRKKTSEQKLKYYMSIWFKYKTGLS
jgi:hypothetical protein